MVGEQMGMGSKAITMKVPAMNEKGEPIMGEDGKPVMQETMVTQDMLAQLENAQKEQEKLIEELNQKKNELMIA